MLDHDQGARHFSNCGVTGVVGSKIRVVRGVKYDL